MSADLHNGDCVEVMRTLEACSVDAIVTDPPYGLEFMGKDWDAPWKTAGAVLSDPAEVGGFQDGAGGNPYSRSRVRFGCGDSASVQFQSWCEVWARECLRVLKPGGHLLAFGGSRTYHRMACAIEDAGFEIRDQIMWIYGSGFPKSLDVSKAIDKAEGGERVVIGLNATRHGGGTLHGGGIGAAVGMMTAPATAAAREWDGWGTALKPAHEPIVVARKPLAGTVAANVLAHGTGALNIDGCRIDGTKGVPASISDAGALGWTTDGDMARKAEQNGRWPANVIHDGSDEVVALFPETASGELTPERQRRGGYANNPNCYAGGSVRGGLGQYASDTGSAARFFYCAKASAEDRNDGCAGMPTRTGGMRNTSGQHITRRDGGAPGPRANHHPTVKPTELMRYLVRLVTPPGGIVLDPFTGSGSTGKAAAFEDLRFIGIERDPEYFTIASARIEHAMRQPKQQALELPAASAECTAPAQHGLAFA